MQQQQDLKAAAGNNRFLWQRPLSFLAASNMSSLKLRPDMGRDEEEEDEGEDFGDTGESGDEPEEDEEVLARIPEVGQDLRTGRSQQPEQHLEQLLRPQPITPVPQREIHHHHHHEDDDDDEDLLEPEVEEEIEVETTSNFNSNPFALFAACAAQPLDLKLNPTQTHQQVKQPTFDSEALSARKKQKPAKTVTAVQQQQQQQPTTTNKSPLQQIDHSKTTRSNLGKSRRLYRCRHCSFITERKVENWQHIRIHMRPEKLLACESCQFVTEYKHHLEYHQRNHSGYKPFNCDHCDYKCVNKSMLNSHMKSHSSVYQYQCGDCRYATKYVHSLKMHLRKYNHDQPTQLQIDVHGRRRGPKSTSSSSCSPQQQQPQQSQQQQQQQQLQDQQQCILDLRVDSKLIQ